MCTKHSVTENDGILQQQFLLNKTGCRIQVFQIINKLYERMLSAFDITKKLFVYVSADNRIKVWNVASGNLEKELVEPKHLTVNYTCLSWPLHHTEKKQSKTNETQLLALGTEMGSIVVWNIAKAEIFKTFDEKKGKFFVFQNFSVIRWSYCKN